MSATRFGLPATTVEMIHRVFAGHQAVERAVLYGSRARGNHKKGSDIDLTLYGTKLGVHDLLVLLGELDDLLLLYTIDLSIFDRLDHAGLREHIERVGQEFYHRQGTGRPVPAEAV